MITSSRIELAMRCEGHLTLPHRDEPNEWSDAGTERHAGDEQAINAGDVPEEYTERWPGLTWRSEVRYAYDVSTDTATFCGTGSSRQYGSPDPFAVGGTVDVEGRGNGLLVVIDRKGFEAQTPAAQHPQVRFLALAAARVQPAERIIVVIRPEIGAMDVAELDPVFDLDVIAHDTKQLLIRSASAVRRSRAGGPVAFNVGRWCRWCPAFAACPKQAELRALVVRDDEDPELALQTFVDDESAAEVYALWKRIGILHKRLAQQLHAYAATRPIQVGNGRMFGPVEKRGNEKLDGDVVWAAMTELFGRELADSAVIRTATKARLKEILKGRKGAERKVLDLVRSRGGITSKPTTTIEEYAIGGALSATDEPKQLTDGDSPI